MKKLVSIILSIVILSTTMVTALAVNYGEEYQALPTPEVKQQFSDVPKTHWAFSYIAEMANRGVINGYPDGTFLPDNQVQRAEFAKIMVSAAGLRVVNNNISSFNDVYTSDWYCPYVECAKDYLTGYSTNSGMIYKPETPALREDIAVALVKLKGYDISLADVSILNMFTDNYSISESAKKYVAVAVERGIISGYEDKTFRGQSTISRAEAATLLWRAFQYGNDNKITDTPTTQDKPSTKPNTPSTTPNTTPTETPNVSEPTTQPNNTPDTPAEPTVEQKKYKIDTLVNANITGNIPAYTTSNDSDTIYYVSDNKIYSANIQTKKQEQLFDISSLETRVGFDKKYFELAGICYDKNNDRLLFQGRYKTNAEDEPYLDDILYTIENGKAVVVAENIMDAYTPLTTLSNGDYLMYAERFSDRTGIYMLNGSDYHTNYNVADIHLENTFIASEYNDGILFATQSGSSIDKIYYYDYVETNPTDLPSPSGIGISSDSFVLSGTNDVMLYLRDDEQIYIGSDDYTIADKRTVDFEHSSCKLFLMKDNSIIFYDTTAKSFRMISENK